MYTLRYSRKNALAAGTIHAMNFSKMTIRVCPSSRSFQAPRHLSLGPEELAGVLRVHWSLRRRCRELRRGREGRGAPRRRCCPRLRSHGGGGGVS